MNLTFPGAMIVIRNHLARQAVAADHEAMAITGFAYKLDVAYLNTHIVAGRFAGHQSVLQAVKEKIQ